MLRNLDPSRSSWFVYRYPMSAPSLEPRLAAVGGRPRKVTELSAAEAQHLKSLFIQAFLLRAAVAVALEWSGYSSRLAPDEETYSRNGWYLSLFWSGDLLTLPERLLLGNIPPGYFYINAAFFTLFGNTLLPIKLVNSLVGAYAGRYVYLLARGLFGEAEARRAVALFLFFPSQILWSALNVRDIWVVLIILVVSWRSYVLVVRYSNLALFQLIGSIYMLSLFRDHLFLAVAAPPLIAFLIGTRGNLARNLLLSGVAATAVLVLWEQGAVSEHTQSRMSLEALSAMRKNMATGGSSFAQDVDISTPGGALAFLPLGVSYFLFSPFPWQITSILKAVSLPEMLVVYYLVPSIIRGIAFAIRHRLRESLQVLLITGLLTLTYSLGEGNVGTLYRHRAQATAFYLMFAAVGLELRQGGAKANGQVPIPRRART